MNLSQAIVPRPLHQLLVPLLVVCATATPTILNAQQPAPDVDVWFEQGNEFDRGEPGRVMYSGAPGSYVTVLRVDTDGRLTILSPRQPNSRSKFNGDRSGVALPFQADAAQGVGYVFAVASRTPFDFRSYRGRGNNWETGRLGQHGGFDPFEMVDRFARSSVGRRGSYSIAYAPYEIGRGGVGRASYPHGVRYDDGMGYYNGGYDDPWGASPYRRGYDNYRFRGGYGYRRGYGTNNRYSTDPRTRALRHCPDGTLAPYTTSCAAFARPGQRRAQQRPGQQPRHQLRQPMPRPVPQPRAPRMPQRP
jgi:hypothetical protein